MPTTTHHLDPSEVLAPNSYAMRVIRYRAAWLVRLKVVPESEQQDVEQELSLRLLKRLKKYDPERSKLNTYVANSVRYEAHEVLRQCFAIKRFHHRNTRTLDVAIGRRFGRRRSLGDLMTRSQQVRGRGRTEQDDQHQVDLHEDVQTAIATLPPDLRKVCEKMFEARTPSAARRAVSASALAAIRQHFAEAGLRAYL